MADMGLTSDKIADNMNLGTKLIESVLDGSYGKKKEKKVGEVVAGIEVKEEEAKKEEE